MSTREKRMLLVVGVLGLVGLIFGVYQMILVPLQESRAEFNRLSGEQGEKSTALDLMRFDLKRLPAAKKRSLPADLDVAKREYEATLSFLMRDSGVPAGYTIVPKDASDLRSVPEIGPKKPAYNRIGYDVRMQKVDLPTLTKVLKGYYDLNLLQQITHLDVKRVEKEGSSGGISRRGADRADLEVTLHTEAIILDGAENRRTLLPIPDAVAAVGGNLAYLAMQNMPEANRKQKIQLFPPVLAAGIEHNLRDYLVMEARDPYHGSLPPPKPEVKVPDKVDNGAGIFRAPPEDTRHFIVLNAITTNTAGVRQATIWDKSMNHIYEVSILDDGGKPEVKAEKFYVLGGQFKRMERNAELVIAEEGTTVDRKFKVIAFHEDGLVLSESVAEGTAKEKDAKAAPEPKKNNTRPGGAPGRDAGKDKAPVKATKEQNALSGTVGGIGMTRPVLTESVFVWRIGQTLDLLKPLPTAEGHDLLKKVTATVPTPPVPPELAPSPRGLEN
ncbi:hypothetical protein [Limnoglobus roseus]|uniref:Uncharacterized protein n=1 Tax=Limnoglobus roseus TaxID=2598579 RepID=A0A5C1AKS7_9BACT|nr:hypothetical protein [Limnoglobus roseus]QEL18803.1 hypothetical protein PX52LOC_05843 [Limnoglobus roseus]